MRAATTKKKTKESATPKKAAPDAITLKKRNVWPPDSVFTVSKMVKCLRAILTRTHSLESEVESMRKCPVRKADMTSFLLRSLRHSIDEIDVEWSQGTRPLSMTSNAKEDGGWIQFFHGKPSPGEVVGADIGPVYWFDSSIQESSVQAFAAFALGVELVFENYMDSDPLFQELADENAGITAPTPVPMWKPYKDHPGTTLPKDWQHPNRPELKGWKWYPVVQHDVEPAHVITIGKRCRAHVEVCQQDGCWVEGIDYSVDNGGGGYAPGRTGGEHASALHAELYGWERILKSIDGHPQSTKEAKEAMRLQEAIKLRIVELRANISGSAGDNATQGQPAKRYVLGVDELPYIGAVSYTGPWILVANDGSEWMVNGALAPGWKCIGIVGAGLGLMAPKGLHPEAHKAQLRAYHRVKPPLKGKALATFQIGLMNSTFVADVKARNGAMTGKPSTVTNTAIGRKLKKKLGHQAGDVLDDGTMVVDPINSIIELHDQVNEVPVTAPPATAPTPEPAAPASSGLMERVPGGQWKPATTTAHNLTELAAPFGKDRREREVVKKRFKSMYGKLSTWPADQRKAFLEYITVHTVADWPITNTN